MSTIDLFCPNCNIGIDYTQMRKRKCNNCSHEFEVFHVLPNNDLKPHLKSYRCHCQPTLENNGGNIVCVHSSFDGREGAEWANEILKS